MGMYVKSDGGEEGRWWHVTAGAMTVAEPGLCWQWRAAATSGDGLATATVTALRLGFKVWSDSSPSVVEEVRMRGVDRQWVGGEAVRRWAGARGAGRGVEGRRE
jgi:hypothetical protein